MEELEFDPSEITFICLIDVGFNGKIFISKGRLWISDLEFEDFAYILPDSSRHNYILDALYQTSWTEEAFRGLDEEYMTAYLFRKMEV